MTRCCGDMPPATGDNSFIRRSGWSLPLHPLQSVSWSFILVFLIAHFGLFAHYIPAPWRILGYVIPGVASLSHIVLHLIATSINPGDANVRKRGADRPSAVFDRTIRSHVIEHNECCLCVVEVDPTAKHCSACNKCVYKFDHHCKWLNNCVGGRNYRLFIATLASGIITILLMMTLSLYITVQYFVDQDKLKYFDRNDNGTYMFNAEVPDLALAAVAGIDTVLLLIALALVCQLFFFHVYLMANNLSTYDYIMNGNKEEEEEEEVKKSGDLERGLKAPDKKSWKKNKVAPASDEEVIPPHETKIAFERESTPEGLSDPLMYSTPHPDKIPLGDCESLKEVDYAKDAWSFDATANPFVTQESAPNTDIESLKEIPISDIHVPRTEAERDSSVKKKLRRKTKQLNHSLRSVNSMEEKIAGRRTLPPLEKGCPPMPVIKCSNVKTMAESETNC